MAIIKAFKGLRAVKGKELEVASFPYDVINSNEAKILANGNPNSFLHIAKPEIDLNPGVDVYSKTVYLQGKKNLINFIERNVLFQDKKEMFYIYRLKKNNHTQTGLFACTSVFDYENEIIKKHEQTLPEKELDRINHINIINAHTEPVFMTYRANESIDTIIEENTQKDPLYDFETSDGINHTLYAIDNREKIIELTLLFEKVDRLYIADGHHRSASAVKVASNRRKENPDHTKNEEYNYFLSILFPNNQLNIMDYNRGVLDLNNNSKESFIEQIKDKFEIEKTGVQFKPNMKHTIGMFLIDSWYKLTVKNGTFNENDPISRLDVNILQNNLLCPILGICDPRVDHRIEFIGGIRGLDELEKRVNNGKYKVAFAMYPTSINELMIVADKDEIMPPKSTWFEPKPRSGLVVHLI